MLTPYIKLYDAKANTVQTMSDKLFTKKTILNQIIASICHVPCYNVLSEFSHF